MIAILDWELSTIGHPLLDTVYLVSPYWNRASRVMPVPGAESREGLEVYDEEKLEESGMPSMGEVLDVYMERAGWDPRGDGWEVAKVFHLMRVSGSYFFAYFFSRLFYGYLRSCLSSCFCFLSRKMVDLMGLLRGQSSHS